MSIITSIHRSGPVPLTEIFKTLYLDNQTELRGLPQHKSCRKYMSSAFKSIPDTFAIDLEAVERIIIFFKVR